MLIRISYGNKLVVYIPQNPAKQTPTWQLSSELTKIL